MSRWPLWLEVLADLAKLAFFSYGAYRLLGAYARRRQPGWAAQFTRRRLSVLGALVMVMTAIKLIEDVLSKEAGPVDAALLWWLHGLVPPSLSGFFSALTLSGATTFLLPATLAAVAALGLAKRAREAWLMAATMLSATLLIYALKSLVMRERPELWSTQWYWGSSFPSGHTLASAAFATAAALCVSRLWPRAGGTAVAVALAWAGLVALSRLVLGVHWPSDVLAALCLGVFIALGFSLVFDAHTPDAP